MQLGISARIKTPSACTKVETRSCTRFLVNRRRVWRIFVGLFLQVTKPDDITSSLYGWVSRTFGKINVVLMALGVENEIKKPARGWTCNQPDKGVYVLLISQKSRGQASLFFRFLDRILAQPQARGRVCTQLQGVNTFCNLGVYRVIQEESALLWEMIV